MTSKHWTQDREERAALIAEIGIGKIVKVSVVDKGHPNGPEIHTISGTGIITIYNQRTHKMITQLIARVAQIYRYYADGEKPPKQLIAIAREHQNLGYFER